MSKEKLTYKVIVLMSESDVKVVDNLANEKHMSRGFFIRESIRDAIKKHEINYEV